MEEFKKLNWLWKTSWSTTSSLYARNFADDDTFFCHLNEIDHIHLLDDYGKNVSSKNSQTQDIFVRKDPRTGHEITKEFFDHTTVSKTTLFSNFPQQSSMNSKQHQSCLNAIAKLRNDTTDASISDRDDIRTYAQLSMERANEKKRFLDFVKDEFDKRNIKNCYDLQPELNKFITKRWTNSVEKVLASNKSCYQLQSAIPIGQSNCTDEIKIEHEKTIQQTGVVLAVNSKKYSNPMRLSCAFLEDFFSNNADITVPLDQLISNHPVDVVISLKTLSSLLTYATDLTTDWSVTFTLTQRENNTVIIFDGLLPVSLECLVKNRLAFQYSVKAAIAVPKKKEVFCFEANRFVERPYELSTPSVLPDAPDSQSTYKVWHYEEYLNKFTDPVSTNNSTADSNHIRRLWNIRHNNVDCRLVIDNSQDFCEKQVDGRVTFINLSPKIEYQCEFGAEQMSVSELISEWCELRFGPNTITHRVRIDARSGCVLNMKEIAITDVEHDLRRLYQIKAEFLLKPLLNIIEIIKQFPPNEYMLRHLEKHNTQAMVYVKSNETSSINTIHLVDICKRPQVDTSPTVTIPWNPIDDTVCTSIHTKSGVMPCAFPHWGKTGKKGNNPKVPSNDRELLVQKAVEKDRTKVAAIAKIKELKLQKTKTLKKAKAKLKKVSLAKQAKLEKLNFEGESIDPNELFDRHGNIHILGLAKKNRDEENNQPDGESVTSEPMCFDTYCQDADVSSDGAILD